MCSYENNDVVWILLKLCDLENKIKEYRELPEKVENGKIIGINVYDSIIEEISERIYRNFEGLYDGLADGFKM